MASKKLKSSLAAEIEQSVAQGRSTSEGADEFSRMVARALQAEEDLRNEIIEVNQRKKESKLRLDAEIADFDAARAKNQNDVWMSNALGNAAHGLNMNEKRLVLLAAAKLVPNAANKSIRISLGDWMQTFEMTRPCARLAASEAAAHLFEREIRWMGEDEDGGAVLERMRWVYRQSVFQKNGDVAVAFSPDLLPHLTDLHEKFFHYNPAILAKVSSKHGIRLFELLTQFKRPGKRSFTVEQLKFLLEIPSSYADFAQIRSRILKPAIESISHLLDIECVEHKNGRSIERIDFIFNSVKKTKEKIRFKRLPPRPSSRACFLLKSENGFQETF